MNKLLEEKDEHISHLQERVSTLEQRVQDVGLSEDERIKALESEVRLCSSQVWKQHKHACLFCTIISEGIWFISFSQNTERWVGAKVG